MIEGAATNLAAGEAARAEPDGYTLLFGTTSDMVVTPIANRATPDWIQTGLATNTAYGLQVTAVNAGGESALSASATTVPLWLRGSASPAKRGW